MRTEKQIEASSRNWTKALLLNTIGVLTRAQFVINIDYVDRCRLQSARELIQDVVSEWDNKSKKGVAVCSKAKKE